ncbi:MAG: ABC transporter ATP-binding protein [Cellulosilyticum sp.]|nr:ABC transporter ATP-binding protein [Cellulosilyticum sp.]
MKETAITVDQLKWQPDLKQKAILNQLSTHFVQGGFYGIMGPNGSGKTSFIRHLLRFLEAKEGEIYLEGKPLEHYSRKQLATYISFVPQNVNIEADFTVYDMIAMGRNPYQKRFQALSKEDDEKIEQAMEITNCKELKERPFSYLSGGEAQRVLVARAIAQDTKYLILDEPISHLDIRYQIELMENLKYLNEKKGKTIIAILHDLNLSAAYCKNMILMKEGSIFASGMVEEVLTKSHLKAVYGIDFEIYEADHRKQRFYIPIISS